ASAGSGGAVDHHGRRRAPPRLVCSGQPSGDDWLADPPVGARQRRQHCAASARSAGARRPRPRRACLRLPRVRPQHGTAERGRHLPRRGGHIRQRARPRGAALAHRRLRRVPRRRGGARPRNASPVRRGRRGLHADTRARSLAGRGCALALRPPRRPRAHPAAPRPGTRRPWRSRPNHPPRDRASPVRRREPSEGLRSGPRRRTLHRAAEREPPRRACRFRPRGGRGDEKGMPPMRVHDVLDLLRLAGPSGAWALARHAVRLRSINRRCLIVMGLTALEQRGLNEELLSAGGLDLRRHDDLDRHTLGALLEYLYEVGVLDEVVPGVYRAQNRRRFRGLLRVMYGYYAYHEPVQMLDRLITGECAYGCDVARDDRYDAMASADLTSHFSYPFSASLLDGRRFRTLADMG